MMRIFLILLLFFACGCSSTPVQAQAPPGVPFNADPDRLRALLAAEKERAGAEAMLFGMWVGEQEVLVTGLGNSMTTVPATPDMHWRIGGIALTMMSTQLLMLVEQGRIDLDEKISRWMPELLHSDQVTVRMLVSNTAGYIDYVTVEDFNKQQEAEPFRTFTDEELIQFSTRDGKMNFPPGTSQAYSHTDNVILGQVIQRATGQSMKELYDQNLFGPLGLKDTSFPVDQGIPEPVLHAFTSERGIYEETTYWNPFWASTPGLPVSTVRDVGRWARVLGTGQLLTPEHFQQQIAPTSVGLGRNRPDLYFAYGMVVSNGWICQNPAMNGYSGAFAYNLSNGVTLVITATRSPQATTDFPAFETMKRVIQYVTPSTPLAL